MWRGCGANVTDTSVATATFCSGIREKPVMHIRRMCRGSRARCPASPDRASPFERPAARVVLGSGGGELHRAVVRLEGTCRDRPFGEGNCEMFAWRRASGVRHREKRTSVSPEQAVLRRIREVVLPQEPWRIRVSRVNNGSAALAAKWRPTLTIALALASIRP